MKLGNDSFRSEVVASILLRHENTKVAIIPILRFPSQDFKKSFFLVSWDAELEQAHSIVIKPSEKTLLRGFTWPIFSQMHILTIVLNNSGFDRDLIYLILHILKNTQSVLKLWVKYVPSNLELGKRENINPKNGNIRFFRAKISAAFLFLSWLHTPLWSYGGIICLQI